MMFYRYLTGSLFCIIFTTKMNTDKESTVINGVVPLDLLQQEVKSGLLNSEAVSTVTIFEGQPPIEYLQNRFVEIVNANPWLRGRLIKKNGKISLEYDESTMTDLSGFTLVENIQQDNFTDLKTDVVKYSKSFAPYLVKKGKDCLNKNELLFKVIVGSVNKNQFILCVSLSHVVGDGFTFYKLYGMLSSDTQVQALVAKRNIEKGDEVYKQGSEVYAVFVTFGLILNMVGKLMFGKRVQTSVSEVDLGYIQQVKEEYRSNAVPVEGDSSAPRFLSTNDILTAAYMSASNCDLGLMPINFRNRMEGLDDSLAGNYESVIAYQKGDYEEGRFIRASLQTPFLRRHPERPLLPGFFAKKRAKLSIVTNWCSFYKQVLLPGECKHVAHFPVFTTLDNPYVLNVCIIFMVAENAPAIFSFEHRSHPVLSKMREMAHCSS